MVEGLAATVATIPLDGAITISAGTARQREGVLREELRIRGVWVDHTLYSLLEHERDRRTVQS